MNDLTINNRQLPDTIEELSTFVFVGREKLIALKSAIKACSKSSIISEKLNEMREEEQLLAENVLIAEMRIGELLKDVPREQGTRTELQTSSEPKLTSKQKAISDIGISDSTAKRYQTLAKHPELVEQAIENARNANRPVTRQEVLNKIAPTKQQEKKQKFAEAMESQRQIHEGLKAGIVNFENGKQVNQNYKVFAENLKHEINLTYVKAVRLNAWKEDDLERIASEFDKNTQNDLVNKINLILIVLQNIRRGILNAKR